MLKALPTSQTILPDIINENYVFIDKTQFIEKYEESKKKGFPVFKTPAFRENHVYRDSEVLL